MKNKFIDNVIDGAKIGLRSFIILYGFSLILSLLLNITVIEQLKDYMQGTMSGDVGFDFSLIVRMAVFIVNISFFHSAGLMKFGFIIFVVLPFISFSISILDNKEEGLGDNLIIYFISSLLFTLLIGLVSFFVRGDILGVTIDFVSLRNIVITFFLAFIIQLIITFSRHLDSLQGVYLSKSFIKYTASFTLLVSFVFFVVIITKFIHNFFLVILMAIVIVPNIAVYLFFAMIGIPLEFSEHINNLLVVADINLNVTTLPIYLRIILIVVLLFMVLLAILSRKTHLTYKNIAGFTVLMAIFAFFLSVVTQIDLSAMTSLFDFKIYINSLSVFLVTAIYVGGFSIALYLPMVKYKNEKKKDNKERE